MSEAAPAPAPLLEAPLPEAPQALPAEEPQAPRLSTEELERLVMGGTTQFREGKYDEAAASFLQVINEDGDNVDAQLAYAVSRFATGDYQSSAMAIRRGIALFPEVVNSLFDLRSNYGEQEDFLKHLRSLEQWLGEHNDDSDAAVVLAFVYHFTGHRGPAAELFKQIKTQAGEDDQKLAEVFVNAKPIEQLEAEAAKQGPAVEAESVPATQPAVK